MGREIQPLSGFQFDGTRLPTEADRTDVHRAAAVFSSGGRVLFVGYDDPSKGVDYFIPGGKVDSGESNIGACVREIHEEIGGVSVQVSDLEFLGSFPQPRANKPGRNRLVHFYSVRGWKGNPDELTSNEPGKHFRWVGSKDTVPLTPFYKNIIVPFLQGNGLMH